MAKTTATTKTSTTAPKSTRRERCVHTLKAMAAPAPAAKGGKAPKAPKATPAPAKATPAPASKPAVTKPEGYTGKRAAILKALAQLKATVQANAQPAEKIALKAGLTEADVKHYCYKNQTLATEGLIAICKLEGVTGLHYFLTTKGQKAKLA